MHSSKRQAGDSRRNFKMALGHQRSSSGLCVCATIFSVYIFFICLQQLVTVNKERRFQEGQLLFKTR